MKQAGRSRIRTMRRWAVKDSNLLPWDKSRFRSQVYRYRPKANQRNKAVSHCAFSERLGRAGCPGVAVSQRGWKWLDIRALAGQDWTTASSAADGGAC